LPIKYGKHANLWKQGNKWHVCFFCFFLSALMPGIDGFLLQVMGLPGGGEWTFRGQISLWRGCWGMANEGFKVPRRLRAWSRRPRPREEENSCKRRNVGNDSFQTLFVLFTGSSQGGSIR
jgi:hypothetical protein